MSHPIPRVLSIAGTDPSGGAGVQADIKTFAANRAYGMAVMTSLVAQSTRGVAGVHHLPPEFVRQQIRVLLDDITPDATKIGMLGNADVVRVVSDCVDELGLTVLDPVIMSTSGHALLDDPGLHAIRALAARVDLVTPNIPEAALLLGLPEARSLGQAIEHAHRLRDLGSARVLLKGGHLEGEATDIFLDEAGVVTLSAPRIPTRHTHGTGCALSSAIAALVPQRASWVEAVRDAKAYLHGAISAADVLNVGHGKGPVHHLHPLW